jgi:CheY-like chemotaxis protein
MARILIVDDDEGIRKALGRHLTRHGHEVKAVSDFTYVRETIDARLFDIAFLDFLMPIMDGKDVCATLRIAQKENDFELVEPPPIVLMTGYPELLEKDAARPIDQCVQYRLNKPFTLEEVDQALAHCLAPAP